MLIVGLGNPGEKYKNNRHNVGFLSVNYLTTQLKDKSFSVRTYEKFDCQIFEALINTNKFLFVKPQTFMNNSGSAVKKVLDYFKIDIKNLIVIHDDLDIPLGKFKIQKASGPKLHNGILSIEKELKTKDFTRIRIGVDNRNPKLKIDGERYVLSDFTKEEKKQLDEIFEKINNKIFPSSLT